MRNCAKDADARARKQRRVDAERRVARPQPRGVYECADPHVTATRYVRKYTAHLEATSNAPGAEQ